MIFLRERVNQDKKYKFLKKLFLYKVVPQKTLYIPKREPPSCSFGKSESLLIWNTKRTHVSRNTSFREVVPFKISNERKIKRKRVPMSYLFLAMSLPLWLTARTHTKEKSTLPEVVPLAFFFGKSPSGGQFRSELCKMVLRSSKLQSIDHVAFRFW